MAKTSTGPALPRMVQDMARLAQQQKDNEALEWLERARRMDANKAKMEEALELLAESEGEIDAARAQWEGRVAALEEELRVARAALAEAEVVGSVEAQVDGLDARDVAELAALRELRAAVESYPSAPPRVALVIVKMRKGGM